MTLEVALIESPDLKDMYVTNPTVKEIIDTSMVLEGLPRNTGVHACFNAETLVQTNDGFKEIKDIKVGDKVLTHNNNFKEVAEVLTTKTNHELIVETRSALPIKVTGNHPMYVKQMTTKSKKRSWSKPFWKNAENLNVNTDYIGIAINQESIIPSYKDLNLDFESKDFWWVIGRFIGDGWLEDKNRKASENYVVICCSKKTDEELNEITAKLDKLNMTYRIVESNTTYKVFLHKTKDLYSYLLRFGKGASNKELISDVLNLPVEYASSFLDGYLSADGSYLPKTKRYSFKTTSKKLAIGISSLIHKVYKQHVSYSILKAGTDVIEGRTVNRKEKYNVIFFKEAKPNRNKSFYEDGFIWTSVKNIQVIDVEEKTMYNLSVYDDNSYTANNLIAHNCGVLIAPGIVEDYLPQVQVFDDEKGIWEDTTQVTMSECEELGLLKMDFLGLRTMGVSSAALDLINKKRNEANENSIKFKEIPLTDVKVYEFISKGETEGVFQLESPGMTVFMKDLFQDVTSKLRTNSFISEKKFGEELFERLIAGISLYRPGPLDEIPNYIKFMLDSDKITYDINGLDSILNNTYSVIVYQEQVMFIVRELAGFTKGQADTIRKAMGKKIKAILDEYKVYFIYGSEDKGIKGCVNNGISEEAATALWDKMEKFGRYA